MSRELMAHLVAGYPSAAESEKVAQALVDGGATMLEIQFPFSDPSADGPVIQTACYESLDAGFKLDAGFDLVKKFSKIIPVFIMSYGNIPFAMGIEKFIDRALDAGAKGLIIPDLAPGHDEGLYDLAAEKGIDVIPVIVPNITDERLAEITARKLKYIYAAMRAGITGQKTDFDAASTAFLSRVEKMTDARVLAGFGIRERSQADFLQGKVFSPVVGSALVKEIAAGKGYEQRLTKLVASLV